MAQSTQAVRTRPRRAATVDEYLAQLDEPARKVLSRLRTQIKKAAPEAREVISYQIPTYLFHGPLLHFAAQPKHLALYAISPDVIEAFTKELEPFDLSGRTIRFTPEKPLPARLVTQIVKMRLKEAKVRIRS